jgi:hypothetical protein
VAFGKLKAMVDGRADRARRACARDRADGMIGAMANSKAGNAVAWILQIAAAAMFLMAGGSKLAGAQPMVEMFAAIGVGQWFRYVTGTIEVVSALLLLMPSMAAIGGALLVCVMVGAIIAHLTILHTSPPCRSCCSSSASSCSCCAAIAWPSGGVDNSPERAVAAPLPVCRAPGWRRRGHDRAQRFRPDFSRRRVLTPHGATHMLDGCMQPATRRVRITTFWRTYEHARERDSPHHVVPRRRAGRRRLLHAGPGAAAGQADGADGRQHPDLSPLLRNADAEVGSIATSFPYSRKPGRAGSGQLSATVYTDPERPATFWKDHFDRHKVEHSGVQERFGRKYVRVQHPSDCCSK